MRQRLPFHPILKAIVPDIGLCRPRIGLARLGKIDESTHYTVEPVARTWLSPGKAGSRGVAIVDSPRNVDVEHLALPFDRVPIEMKVDAARLEPPYGRLI